MTIYDINVRLRNNEEVNLGKYKGKVLLIVNTATGCGFTPQYKELEELYNKYKDKGFEVLDFPCNQFGNQAPGNDDEIHEFCTLNYNTSFDRFRKIDVNGDNEDKLFTFLKEQAPLDDIHGLKNKMAMKAIEKISKSIDKDSDIKWNFTKFLVDREGNVIGRFSPTTKPFDIENMIKEAL